MRDPDAATLGATDQARPRHAASHDGGKSGGGTTGTAALVEKTHLLDAGGREVHVHGKDPDILALHLAIPSPAPRARFASAGSRSGEGEEECMT